MLFHTHKKNKRSAIPFLLSAYAAYIPQSFLLIHVLILVPLIKNMETILILPEPLMVQI